MNANWGTGGSVVVSTITTEMNRALQSSFLSNGDYHRDGTLEIIFSL